MTEWAVSRLIRLAKKYNFAQKDLQSCMTFDVKHFHETTHYKTSVMTMLQHCRSFGELMKMLKNYQIGVPTTLQITVENMMSFHDIQQLSQPSTVKMSFKDQEVLIEFSKVYGQSVCQRTGRQEITVAKAGTLPCFSYDSTHSDTHVLLRQTMNKSDREEQME